LAGGALVLALLGLSLIYFERDRPYRLLRKKLGQLSAGERERLIVTEWRGAYRKLADAINQAIDKAVEKASEMAPQAKKKANLDEILGPTPQSNVEPYFGFADAPQPKAAVKTEPLKIVAKSTGQLQIPVAAPAPPMAAAGNAPAFNPAVVPAAPIKVAAPAPVSSAKLQAPPPRAPVASPSNGAVHVANDNDEEAMHFREVYTEYLSLRKECGESTDGLSYEKFENTLTKTRDQVLSKHPAKSVRFTVYVKEGKAALKAAPVKR
ncbi:MAG TPA: MXAN_5187 C-terminal domain-containing protein, partial [Polyangiales bacterium]|nr:MXAN_5187 C-terminal domain-containing protein [Polyangiales bacterium]